MKSFNRVMLIGHLAADPELRETKKGNRVANFPIAINRFVKDSAGQKTEAVDFHRVITWGGLAQISSDYLSKGQAVCVDGRLRNNSFEDKEGNKHYRTEVVADDLSILTWKKSNTGNEVEIQAIDA
ncbi:single-stranded DNA-binding protein [Candidatus Peregrinibacteria bacterium]|jgi:single-strand DNA-binding protein|nr:single-stranded DNA-binding protein [Candidatus Peregrinibacteria bacterium]